MGRTNWSPRKLAQMISTTAEPDPRRWRALAVCLGGAFITMLDVSVVNVALPSIQTALHAAPAQLQLIIAGYTLALALFVVPSGRLGDVRGRRVMFVIGIIGFGATSILAGAAQSDTWLAVVRVLQGAFAGIVNPQNSGLIQQMFRGKERGRAFGYMGATIGVATALGPVIGGAIVTLAGPENGWRWVFFVKVPIVLIVVPLALRLLPPPPPKGETTTRLDVPGVALVGLMAACFMTPFITSGASGGPAIGPWRWWLIGVAVLVAGAFVLWERRYQARFGAAVLDPALVSNVGYRFGVAVAMAYFAGFSSLFLVVTMALQSGFNYSPLVAGLVGAAFAVGATVAAPVAGRMVGRFGRIWVVGGLTLMLAGLVGIDAVLRWTPASVMAPVMAAAMLMTGLGSGSVISPNQTLTLASVPPRIGGVAGAVLQVGQQTGASMGTAVVLSGFFVSEITLGVRGAAAHVLLASMAMVAVALALAVSDLLRRRNRTDLLS